MSAGSCYDFSFALVTIRRFLVRSNKPLRSALHFFASVLEKLGEPKQWLLRFVDC